MASQDDLKGILKSVNSSTITQVNTLKDVLKVQKRIGPSADKLSNNSNLMPDMSATKDAFEELISLGREQVKFLENIFKIQYEINEREKEALRLAKQPKTDTSVVASKEEKPADTKVENKAGPRGAGGLEDLLGIPAGILAAVSALGLAFAGLRGWEVGVIKSLKESFGKSGIGSSIINGVKNIKNSVLGAFGIGVDGKPIPNSALDSITKNPWIKKLTDGLSKILTPIKTMFGKVAENAGAFAKTVGKILKPIGFLFSAFEGIKAAFNTEGGFFAKLGAFTSAFLGDFFGSFFDLLKDGASWLLEKLGFDGAAKFLDSFSFETLITDLVNGIFSTIGDVWRWLTSELPSVDDIKKSMISIMPDWMKEELGIPLETAAEIVDKKVQENASELAKKEAERAKIEASNKDRSPREIRGVMRPAAPLIDTSELDAEIAALKEKVEAPNQRIDIINQELKALRDEKAAVDIANATPADDGSTAPQQSTFRIDDKLKALEAELKAEMEKEENKKPVAADTNAGPDRLERIFADQQRWTQHLERINKTVGNDKVPVTGGWASALEPIPSVDTNIKPVVGRMIPNLDIPKEVAPLAFKTPSRADIIKGAAAAAAESAEIIEKSSSAVMQEEQNKASDFMNKVEAITKNINELNTNNNITYTPVTDASSKVYNGGNTSTNIFASGSSKSDLDYGLPRAVG